MKHSSHGLMGLNAAVLVWLLTVLPQYSVARTLTKAKANSLESKATGALRGSSSAAGAVHPSSSGGDALAGEDTELEVPAAAPAEPAQTASASSPVTPNEGVAELHEHSADASPTSPRTEDKFDQWLAKDNDVAMQDAKQAALDSQAVEAVRSSVERRKHEEGAIQRKLARAIKWGQDLSKLFQSNAQHEHAELQRVHTDEEKKGEMLRREASAQKKLLEAQVSKATKTAQAESETVEQLRTALAESRRAEQKEAEALKIESHKLDAKFQKQALAIQARDDTIRKLKAVKLAEDTRLNATVKKAHEITAAARRTIAQARSKQHAAETALSDEKEHERTMQAQYQDKLSNVEKDLASEHDQTKALQEQVNDLEALAHGDSSVKLMDEQSSSTPIAKTHSNGTTLQKPHSHSAAQQQIAKQSNSDIEAELDEETLLDEPQAEAKPVADAAAAALSNGADSASSDAADDPMSLLSEPKDLLAVPLDLA